MSDARWNEIEGDAASAVKHFAKAVQLHRSYDPGAADDVRYLHEMALMHAMQSGHTSMERAVIRVLRLFGEELPDGPDHHADLMRRAVQAVGERPAIIGPEFAAAATETRKFRHRAMHAYEDFRLDRSTPAVKAAEVLAAALVPAIAKFREAVDP